MTSQVLVRPLEPQLGRDGGVAARRAMARWAWRLFRREWRQQALVLVLIVVAVGTTILGAAVATNTPPPADTGFGTANHLVILAGTDPHLGADIDRIRQQFGVVDVIENQRLATGLAQETQLRAQDPRGAYGRPMLALVSGRYPTGAGQVAMTERLASTLDAHVGGTWRGAGRTFRVVGLIENPQNLLDDFALVAAGQLSRPTQVTVLFDATTSALTGFRFPAGTHPVSPKQSNGISPDLIVFAVAIVGLILVGLVAVAGFSVLAQRRLRGLGMLSSLGATERNVRLVVVTNGAVVGAVGALVGAVIGLAAWIAYAPHLSISAHHRIAWSDIPWWLVAATMTLAMLTTTVAAGRPARAVSRTPVVAALTGRPPVAKAAHRSAVPGILGLLLGLLLLAFSGGWGSHGGKSLLFQLGGLLACAAGLLLIAPITVAMLGVSVARAPVSIRIALRDLSRYRSRSGAALAATSFAALIAVLITLIAAGRFADPVDYFGPNLAANQALLYTPGNTASGTNPVRTASSTQSQTELRSSASAIASTLGSHDVLPLDAAEAFLGQATADGSVRSGPGTIYVATPELLAHYGINPSAVAPTTLLLTSRAGLQGTGALQLVYGDPGSPNPAAANIRTIGNPKIQTFSQLPTETAAPNLIVTSYAVHKLALRVSPGGWLIQAPKSLTALQINTIRQMAAEAGTTIDVKSDAPSLSQLQNYSTAAGILLALGVLAMTVGLIRSETSSELRTLTAIGASSTTRRTITATTAGTIGLLGALLGTAVGYAATTAFFRSQLTERMSHVPVLDLVLILIGMPLAATIGGWLFAGREPAAIAHQPID